MSVNPASRSVRARGQEEVPSDDNVEDDLRTLMRHMRPVFGALKRGGPPPAAFKEAFESASLGPRHGPVLLTCTLEGELSVSDIAERLELSLSTTSLMVGELSRAGLLERAEDEHDRRRTIVRLNETYRKEVDDWLQERLDPLRRTLQRLSPRARANFLEGWRILEEETARLGSPDQGPGSAD
jgi:DNA-binding MarR family transcriptional regulator